LQIQADSSVTTLALVLSQPSNQDVITQELLISALFDSGQFSRIEFQSEDGATQIVRTADAREAPLVPLWFIRFIALEPVQAMAQVNNGWQSVGQVWLEADPAYARQSLWDNFLRLFGWVVLAGVLWALFVFGLVRWLRQ